MDLKIQTMDALNIIIIINLTEIWKYMKKLHQETK